MNAIVIGCGGIGAWLAQCLAKTLTNSDTLTLVDGDIIEAKNIDRQLFSTRDINRNKATMLRTILRDGARCRLERHPYYLGDPQHEFDPGLETEDVIFVGADNHPARALALSMADNQVPCIIAANNYETYEAYIYRPEWQDTPLDPRIYYPEILTDTEGDPLSPPCTGEEQESHPQLALFNQLAAAQAAWLLRVWNESALPLMDDEELFKTLPVKVSGTATRQFVQTVEDIQNAPKESNCAA